MWNKYKNLIFAAVVIVAAAIFIWQVIDRGSSDNNQAQTPAAAANTSAKEVSYEGVAGKNALALLKASHATETKTYKGLGELVTSIDGVKVDSKHFWSFYVNGKPATVGAGSYTTKSGDKIVWKLEEIK
jgi:hypothetical protein